jgi:hypothetical protein
LELRDVDFIVRVVPNHMIEGISEISILEIVPLSASLKHLATSISFISVEVHSLIDRLSNENMIEYLPAMFFYFFREEVIKFTVIEIGVELLQEQCDSLFIGLFFFKFD